MAKSKTSGQTPGLFIVVDHEGYPSWNEKANCPEGFSSYDRASSRALQMAEGTPGKLVTVFKVAATVTCHVGRPEIHLPE